MSECRKVYKYSRSQTRHLAVFCVKLTNNSGSRSCAFLLRIFLVRGIQMIFVCIVVYMYVRNVRSLAVVGGRFLG